MQSIGYTLTSLAFFALLTLTLLERGHGWLSTIFGSRILRFFGKYSYALYVLHQPIYIGFESAYPTTRIIEATGSANLGFLIHSSISIALSIGAALISWNLLEVPFLRMKSLFEYRGAAKQPLSPVRGMSESLPVAAPVAQSKLEPQ
jgi:peptidoglycan/LPS O-acetylase OafA/YrhL